MFQDRLLAGVLKMLRVLLRGALADDENARKAALREAEQISRGLKP